MHVNLMCLCRFLMTWTSFLPIALYYRFQWCTPFVAAVITFLLFGVENIGVQVGHVHHTKAIFSLEAQE